MVKHPAPTKRRREVNLSSNLSRPTKLKISSKGERLVDIQEVVGSLPTSSTSDVT